jgi:Phage capsid protein
MTTAVTSLSGDNPFDVELATQQYTTRLEALLQQKVSVLRGLVTSVGGYRGKQASPVQQIGTLEFKAPSGRFSPLQPIEPNYTRRWVSPTFKDLPVLVDVLDELQTIVDPKAGISEAVVMAANRFFDDLIINAFFAAAKTGVEGGSSESWPATTYLVADTFGAAASTGMTYPKLVEAFRLMRHHQVDLDNEEPAVVIGSQQEADLKKQQEVINRDYNGGMVVESGRIMRIAGFTVHVSERLHTSSSDSLRNCPAFVKSGMHLGLWQDLATSITERQDLSEHPWQLYSQVGAGATRLELGKVIQINCADTSSVDPTAP